jgi:GNAT superfamily N-acetyltransferase
MRSALTIATPDDVETVAALRNAVAEQLTARHGIGHWSSISTARGIRAEIQRSSVCLLRDEGRAIATLALATRKPRAIDRRYFTPDKKPLYLLGMAVEPSRQRTGVGRRCIEEAVAMCRAWPADALCLDAYDADAGAGDFYRKCGFTEVGRATYRNNPLIYFERLV